MNEAPVASPLLLKTMEATSDDACKGDINANACDAARATPGMLKTMEATSDDACKGDINANAARKPNPLTTASFLSKLTFSWPYPLLKMGMQRPLDELDLPDIPQSDTSAYNLRIMNDMWDSELERTKKSNKKKKMKKTAAGKSSIPAAPSLHRAFIMDFLRTVWYV